MDDIFTHNLSFNEKVTDEASYSEESLRPSKSSLEFIKNFARNFRVYNAIEGRAQELLLNWITRGFLFNLKTNNVT